MSDAPLLPLSQTGRAILTALQQYPEGLSRYGIVQVIDQFSDKSILRMISTLKTQGFLSSRIDEDGAMRFVITEEGVTRLATSPQPRLNPLERDGWLPQSWSHPYKKPIKRPKPQPVDTWPADPTTMKHPVYPPRKVPPKMPDPMDVIFLEIPDATP